MRNKIIIREDFRRDGLAINFWVDEELMVLVAKAFPGCRLQVGYPAVCSEEAKMCSRILKKIAFQNVEPTLSGHALKEHLNIMGRLISPYPIATANFWIPISDDLINKTLKRDSKDLLTHAIDLLNYWGENFPKNKIDVALVDCTAVEKDLEKRVAYFAKHLHAEGVRTVIICDTKGQSNPPAIRKLFETIREIDSGELEFHPHNDNGKALRNVDEAIKLNVNLVGTALFNSGERFSMLDPRELIDRNLAVEHNSDYLNQFLKQYQEKNITGSVSIQEKLKGNTFITGTQYRLFGRKENAELLFGVTSDKYILSKLSGNDTSQIDSTILNDLKNSLYFKKQLFYTASEIAHLYDLA